MKEILYNNPPVEYNGEIKFYLNARLIAKQGLDEAATELLVTLHQERLQIEDAMRQAGDDCLKDLYAAWLSVQHDLQEVWKFGIDDKFIKFWEVPRCTCPKMDNNERFGTGYYITALDCPVHGDGHGSY